MAEQRETNRNTRRSLIFAVAEQRYYGYRKISSINKYRSQSLQFCVYRC